MEIYSEEHEHGLNIELAAITNNMKQIHTEIVNQHNQNIPDNKILQTKAPDIDKSENTLSRSTRTLLAQLRTGKSSFLLTSNLAT